MALSAGGSAQADWKEISINLTVLPYAEVTAPDAVQFEVPGIGAEVSKNITVEFSANSPVMVMYQRKGFENAPESLKGRLNNAVTIIIEGNAMAPLHGFIKCYSATTGLSGSYEVPITVVYNPGDDWPLITAGKYADTVIWTVSARETCGPVISGF